MQKPEYHVFICTSSRLGGQQKGYCISRESAALVQAFMEEVENQDLTEKVMITNTGCFGICSQGPVVVVYPEGVWYKGVGPDDVPEIVESHFANGQKVDRLEIK